MNAPTAPHVPGAPPDFGALILERKPQRVLWLVFGAIIGLLIVPFLLIGVVFTFGQASGSQNSISTGLGMAIPSAVLLVLLVCMVCSKAFTRVRFYEHGTIKTRFGRVRSAIPHSEVSVLTLSLTRQYIYGLYCGTWYSMKIKAKGRGTIAQTGRHKERAKGLGFTILHQRIEGRDEIEEVAGLIARAMVVKRLTDPPGPGGPRVEWGRVAEITMEGIVPKRGPKRGQVVPFQSLRGFGGAAGQFAVFVFGVDKPIVNVPINAPNFHFGLEFLRAVAGAAVDPQYQPEAERS